MVEVRGDLLLSVFRATSVAVSRTSVSADTWYSETHIPDLLKYAGLQGITRYRLAGSGDHGTKATRPIKVKSYPTFLTFYYFKNIDDSEGYDTSPARMAARGDWERIQKETSTSHLWRVRYLPLRTWQR